MVSKVIFLSFKVINKVNIGTYIYFFFNKWENKSMCDCFQNQYEIVFLDIHEYIKYTRIRFALEVGIIDQAV